MRRESSRDPKERSDRSPSGRHVPESHGRRHWPVRFLPRVAPVRALPLTLGLGTGALLARERQVRRNAERLAAGLLETLLNAIDATGAQTGAHVRRVARYALILAEAAG